MDTDSYKSAIRPWSSTQDMKRANIADDAAQTRLPDTVDKAAFLSCPLELPASPPELPVGLFPGLPELDPLDDDDDELLLLELELPPAVPPPVFPPSITLEPTYCPFPLFTLRLKTPPSPVIEISDPPFTIQDPAPHGHAALTGPRASLATPELLHLLLRQTENPSTTPSAGLQIQAGLPFCPH
ncbi:hypothetical protein EXIGLDRAFT_732057 [Exidia glandulosa HHB12029]|uniref:Uncharacterized protein n=1 Tax=Exidia glandulosa HHB12029 TaxID=1314781 RepID=A0A165KWE5_EXIGL|nr:hypothetical protein EXIGLDRAFT_732057 [Exidia glandulosa HHB12029]